MFETRYRSRYHRPRGFRNFRGDVFVFGDELIRFGFAVSIFGFATSVTCVVFVVFVDDGKSFIQCFCGGKSLSEIFCTQTSGWRLKSIVGPLTNVGDRKNFERVDIFLSVRSKILVVVVVGMVLLIVVVVVVDAAANLVK